MTGDEGRSLLAWLEDYYASRCDGAWEHDHGVQIDTLDNPGWRVQGVQVVVGPDCPSAADHVERTETNWISYKVEKGRFIGHSGPKNLAELLAVLQNLITEGSLRGEQT
jgi:hypothetical protein